ncbi:uncharacterized protein LOC109832972 [Asparagus officinalis]|uniref:uncharacterized protein LOC109832972 n=1 Tax=Asparagus officinalis TaxID=4686 RepID=UPI00098E425A|nr:uncharacterized protein LOC109832972 [Asparagus officinalis]
MKQSSRKEEIKVMEKRVLRSKYVKEREEADSSKGLLALSAADRKRDNSSRRKKAKNDQLSSERETKLNPKKISKLKVTKERDGADSVKKSGPERKRSREAVDDKTSLKKFRLGHLKHKQEEGMESCEGNIKRKFLRSGDKRSKPNEERMQEDSERKTGAETENCKWIERSTARTLRKLKANNSFLDSTRKDDVDVSQQSGGVLRVLPSNKKVGGIEEGQIQREEKEERKTKKPISTAKSVKKDQLNPRKVSSGEIAKPGKAKSEASAKIQLYTKGKASEGQSTVKQRIRDQIKGILLDAGWTIELKPRRGRNYNDNVYMPPTGGGGLWSITKAYNVYVKSFNENSSRGNQGHEGKNPTFATVPAELLQMLTKNMVNKRRRKKEIEKAKKLGVRKKGEGNVRRTSSKGAGGTNKLHPSVRNKKRGCALLVRGSSQGTDINDNDGYFPYIWKRTILSWMVDLGIVHVDEKVKYMNKKKTRALLEGVITRDGIRCGCCSKIIPIFKFEIHAGSRLHQPYENILMDRSGISLSQCLLNAWEKQQESERLGFHKVDIEGDDPNDDTCGICGDGGDLICCDGCPSTFHLNCLDLQMLPPGVWHCANCTCRYCGLVSGAVSKEDGSDAYMLLTCSQCERKYHRECIPEEDFVSVHSNDSDTSFCGKTCRKILWQLHKLLGKKNDLEAGLSWRLIRCLGEDSSRYPCNLPQKTECNSKIVVAFAVMDECFRPIIDQRSGINLVHNVVYNCGSNINRLSYTGFYTFVLEREDEIISVASVRIHGAKLAEMPFIGTRNMYRRQGMCRKLLKGIESALYSLNVEILIIPAIAELMETWTSNFGFEPLELLHRKEVSSTNTLIFPGTGLLYKPIVKKGSTEEHTTSDGGELGESATDNGHVSEAPNKHEEEGAGLVLEKTENSDASSKSQSQTPAFESLASATDVDLSTHPKLDQNDITCEDTLGVHSPKEPKIEIPRVGTLHGNQESTNPVFIAMSDQSAGAAKHDTNVKTSYYSADNSTQHLTSPEVDDGALSVNSESNISSACGIKSYVMPPDTHNHRQHIISKDSALVVNGDSACSEIVTASHVHSSIVKSPKLSYAEDSNGGVDSSVCKSGTPGGALNCCLT